MLNIFTRFFLLTSILFFSGCVPYYKLSKNEFPQGKDLENDYDISNKFVKSQIIYDQFTTLAQFDALYLSDKVRVKYVEMFCKKRGKSEEAKAAMLARQLEENQHWISFYVLADVRDVFNSAMNDKSPVWTPYIKLGDECVEPETIKEIELEPEYISLFGSKYNSFKTAYLISFPAKKEESAKSYIDNIDILDLVISSVDKSCTLQWDLALLKDTDFNKKSKITKKEVDFYWG